MGLRGEIYLLKITYTLFLFLKIQYKAGALTYVVEGAFHLNSVSTGWHSIEFMLTSEQ